jgi:ATP-binding cassette subfamily B protein
VIGNSAQAAGSAVRTVGTITSCIPVLGGVVLMFFIDVWCACGFTVGLLALGLLSRHVVNLSQQVNNRYLVTQAGVAVALTEAVAGARTVAAAGASATERRRVLAGVPELHQHGSQLWQVQSKTIARGTILLPAMQVAVLAVAGWRTAAGHLTVGQVFAISGYLALGVRLVTVIGQLTGLGQARGAARRCGELVDVPATVYGPIASADGPGAVTFVEVSAEHSTEPVRALDAHIPAGQSVALVGADGSGKSTFAALIGRLTEPDAGLVCLDGQDVRELSATALHRSVTYAFARPALLGRTITDTIELGATRPDPGRVAAAARAACADGFISRLPDGYETLLTNAPMSGGEAQRLGLARAFAHPGRVLVLDDATSSLDTVTEHQISTALAAAAGRTRIIVARRASTAAGAQRVLWFHEGRVRGDGTHRALWSDPDYRAVFLADKPDVAGRSDVERLVKDERPVKTKPVRPVFAL